jgi:hypothetical protein
MEHKGTEYSVVQTSAPLAGDGPLVSQVESPRPGVPQSKMAVNAAKAAIENAIRVKPEKKQAMQ